MRHMRHASRRRDDRVALFLMDYPRQARLKLLGRARAVEPGEDPALFAALAIPGAAAERAIVVTVEAFDWNCPQHITPRFTAAEVGEAVAPLHARIATLEAELAALRARAGLAE